MVHQTGFTVTVRVLFRGVHVSFPVHYFIVFPVGNGAACGGYLKHAGVFQLEGNCHEAAVAPAIDTDAAGIDIRQ